MTRTTRTVVLGAGGQLGRSFLRLLPSATGFARTEVSITDAAAVREAVRGAELVLNCAAYNGVDAAESEPGATLASEVNELGPGVVAAACASEGARFVHFSTNYVFSGSLTGRAYVEADPVSPAGAYARSKAAGEAAVLAALPSALVIRSSGLYGRDGSAVKGGSFPDRILARARAGSVLSVVDDQELNPTFTDDLALGALRLAGEGMDGVVHLVASGCCSWHEFAVATLELAGLEEAAASVAAVSTASLGAAAARPLNGCLESSRTGALRPWREALAEFVRGR